MVLSSTETPNTSRRAPAPGRRPPAHDAVDRRDRAALHEFRQCPQVLGRQFRRRTGAPTVLQTLRAVRVEPQNPVTHNLQRDATDLRRIRPPSTVIDHRKRQQ